MQKILSLMILVLVLTVASRRVDLSHPCHVKPDKEVEQVIKSPIPSNQDLPLNFQWNNKGGMNYLTNLKQQHIPQYCGSCWAQAATSVISDRLKILRNGAWPDINIAPQVLISCSEPDDGCSGGWPMSGFQYMHRHIITDETCSIYRARGHDNGVICSPATVCLNCNPNEPCFLPDTYDMYEIDEYALVDTTSNAEDNMMQEIYARGPIACGIAVPQSLDDYTGGIYYDDSGDQSIVHAISVVGWGEENGTKYWLVRNSWGTHWGEDGFFRVVRGVNNIAIESDCAWAVPKVDPVLHTTTDEERNDERNNFTNPDMPQPTFLQEVPRRTCNRVPYNIWEGGEERPEIMSWEEVSNEELPENFDWRDIDGVNYLSWNVNQHVPYYCGSCWAQGTTSSLADRFNILDGLMSPTPHALSPQYLINCELGGSCNGGNPAAVYRHAKNGGIPHQSCMIYTAQNLAKHGNCDPIDICRDCHGPAPPAGEQLLENCNAVTDYTKYYVKHYYSLQGASQMKSEIYKNGPISCGIDATTNFEKYTGGIYSEHLLMPMINHEIAVVGWGVDSRSGVEYWIGRNSWGTYWGESGFFRMKMHEDNLAIERDCSAGIPTYEKPNEATGSFVQ